MSALFRRIAGFFLWLRHQVLGRRHGRLVLERADGVPLLVLPTVFNPVLFRTGTFLAETVTRLYPDRAGEGRSALDMGTGSGVGAVFAARSGFRVVGVDINPDAVRCARINVLLNRLEDRVEIRTGDLFAPVGDERFDLVLFNPPFFRGVAKDALDRAWRSPDVIERFARGLPRRLEPGGHALLVLSTDGEGKAMLEALEGAGLDVAEVARRDLGNEVAKVYSASRPE